MATSGFRECAVVGAEPWGGLGRSGARSPRSLIEITVNVGESR